MSVSGPFKYRLTTAFERTCGGDAHPSTCAATITTPSSAANRNVFHRVAFGSPAAHVDGPCGSVSGVPVERRSEPACDIWATRATSASTYDLRPIGRRSREIEGPIQGPALRIADSHRLDDLEHRALS